MHRPFSLLCLLLSLWIGVAAQPSWPPSPTNQLVNDLAGVLSQEQISLLEQRLVAFDDSTSNQILILIVPSLGGNEVQSAAQQVGEHWGVGHQQFNNGVVILIKAKTADEPWGEVALATGYGIEGALPDLYCRRIIDDHMLPALADADYYRALTSALDVIQPAMRGEYSFAQYRTDQRRRAWLEMLPLLLFIAIAIIAIFRYARKHPDDWHNIGRGGGGVYFGGTPDGYWSHNGGGFSSGNFGGFGGFGGGSFGGGGASGRF